MECFAKGRYVVKKIEAIIIPRMLSGVCEALSDIGIEGMTVTESKGFGRQKGHTEIYRGDEYTIDFLPRIIVEVVVPDESVPVAVAAILNEARYYKRATGIIIVSHVIDAIRIRTEERGERAL
jgi:nitrogen regulatory protein PII